MYRIKKLLALLLSVVLMAGLFLGLNLGPRIASAAPMDITNETNYKIVCYALSKLGCGYVSGGGYGNTGATNFDCMGLVVAALKSAGYDTTDDLYGDAAWYSYFSSLTNGQRVSFTDSDGDKVYYRVRKTTSGITYDNNGSLADWVNNSEVGSIPGTILAKYQYVDGSWEGHATVSLGRYDWQGTTAATAAYVKSQLVAQFGSATSADAKKYGTYVSNLSSLLGSGYTFNNSHSGATANFWDYTTRNDGSNFTTKEYCELWQVDALDTYAGVSVNNMPYGKWMQPVYFELIPEVHDDYGDISIYKVAVELGFDGVTEVAQKPLSGITYTLYDTNGTTVLGTAQTNASGIAKFDGDTYKLQHLNTYYVKETSVGANSHVSLDATKYVIKIVNLNIFGETNYPIGYSASIPHEDPVVDGSYHVEKIWSDTNDNDGIRPSSVSIGLQRKLATATSWSNYGGVVLSSVNHWAYTWTELPLYNVSGTAYQYRVVETSVPSGYTVSYNYGTSSTYKAGTGTITNSHQPEKTAISATKTWDYENESSIPESIELELYRDTVATGNTATVTPDSDGAWEYTFSELPKYHDVGTEYVYDIKEINVPGFVASYETDTSGNVTIENKEITTEFEVVKIWDDADDQDGYRKAVTVQLVADADDYGTPITLSADNDWYYKWDNLPSHTAAGDSIVYSVREDIPEHYTVDYAYDYTDAACGVAEITNTHVPEFLSLSGTKTWYCSNDGLVPESVTVRLYQDDIELDSRVVTQGDNWEYTFSELPKYHDSGIEYVYEVVEDPIVGWVANHNENDLINRSTVVEISKADITDSREIPGAVLQIIDAKGEVVKEWTTVGAKTVIEAELEGGATYTLREYLAPVGYYRAEDVTFTVANDGTITKVQMYDAPIIIRCNKFDGSNGRIPLAGSTFELKDSDGKVLHTWVSDGTAEQLGKYVEEGQTYTVAEVAAPEGYDIAFSQTFTVDEAEEITLEYVDFLLDEPETADFPVSFVQIVFVISAMICAIIFFRRVQKKIRG